jgi:hypothetical protein
MYYVIQVSSIRNLPSNYKVKSHVISKDDAIKYLIALDIDHNKLVAISLNYYK